MPTDAAGGASRYVRTRTTPLNRHATRTTHPTRPHPNNRSPPLHLGPWATPVALWDIAKTDLERLHMCRAARRAGEAGPRFPKGHWIVLRLLGIVCAIDVALVAMFTSAGSQGSDALTDGSVAGAVLVGISGTVS